MNRCILLIVVIFLGLVTLLFIKAQLSHPSFDKKELTTIAYKEVDIKTKGIWDKKISLDTIDPSQKAVKGSWWAHDRWDWLAWQKADGNWVILVSLDGYSSKELDAIPPQFNEFFKEKIFQFGKRYCY